MVRDQYDPCATAPFQSNKATLVPFRLEALPEDVLEYWDRPPSFKLKYKNAQGNRVVAVHTSDYFVIRADSAGWEECKTEDELLRWVERSPHRYRRDDNIWCCPLRRGLCAAVRPHLLRSLVTGH